MLKILIQHFYKFLAALGQKSRLLRLQFLFIFVFGAAPSLAYTPAHFVLGTTQFQGIQIYDVIQGQDQNYWIATSDGLYQYDFQQFHKVNCQGASNNVVFNFKMARDGAIFCHNLHNQIFKISAGECRLFYELKDDEAFQDISLTIYNDNELVVGAKKILILDSSGKLTARYPLINSYLSEPILGPKRQLYFPIAAQSVFMELLGHRFIERPFSVLGKKKEIEQLKFYKYATGYFAIDIQSEQQYAVDFYTYTLTPIRGIEGIHIDARSRVYETEGLLWVTGGMNGVECYIPQGKAPVKLNLFDDLFISNVYKDNASNFLLSTFDNGIIVIPNLSFAQASQPFAKDPATAIYSEPELGLIIGTSNGKLAQFKDGKLKVLSDDGKRSITKIFGSPQSDFILFDDGEIKAWSKRTGTISSVLEMSLKSTVFASENKYYVGTNNGIYKLTRRNSRLFDVTLLGSVVSRVYSMSYDDRNKELYASSALGLFVVDSNEKATRVSSISRTAAISSLYSYQGSTYVAIDQVGLLVLRQGNVKDTIPTEINGRVARVFKMEVTDSTIFAQTDQGFFQLSFTGQVLSAIQNSYGFEQSRVLDFSLSQPRLWVCHTSGIQDINLSAPSPVVPRPKLRVNRLYINDSLRPLSSRLRLGSNERKLSLEVCSPVLRQYGSVHFYYRLVGYENKWSIKNYSDYLITYNALPPGNYTLEIRANDAGMFSDTFRLPISIAAPFYQTWWFFLGLAAAIACGIYFSFRSWASLQQKKARQQYELNNSKLTALKSQMNPHFIFNSMNSIQDLILKGKVEESYTYITTFSKLVRSTLSASEQEFIDFEQELGLIELYLKLEKLRFKDLLEYEIELDKMDDILIPPLLIQPFIENALVHGLLHKSGTKQLVIKFRLDEMLICTIEDNGIGRKKAKEIGERQKGHHASFSGKAINARFKILNELYEGQFGFHYTDLFDGQQPKGTRVTLNIPIQHKY